MVVLMEQQLEVDARIRVGQDLGCVRYVGSVIGHTGLWIGVEWDNPKRGRHNGTVNDVYYFQTRY